MPDITITLTDDEYARLSAIAQLRSDDPQQFVLDSAMLRVGEHEQAQRDLDDNPELQALLNRQADGPTVRATMFRALIREDEVISKQALLDAIKALPGVPSPK